jgi:hypothetical protein
MEPSQKSAELQDDPPPVEGDQAAFAMRTRVAHRRRRCAVEGELESTNQHDLKAQQP